MPEKWSYQETLIMRKSYLGKSCKLHFAAAPIKMVRATKQYMYDDTGAEYLDCINNVSHVGHCHPHVVSAGQEQMGQLMTSTGFLSDVQAMYAKRLVETLPERLCVCYFVNSGSEANDLALRLAREYTNNQDLVIVSGAFHGNLGNLVDISPLRWKSNVTPKDHVHIIPCPNLYRGKHRDSPHQIEAYINDAHRLYKNAHSNGRNIGAFICDPLMASSGVFELPPNYLKSIYRMTREAGGVCIADEIQVGMGRIGDHYWAFQCHDVVPDIITCGKPMGNGHPMAVVITTREIADHFGGDFSSAYGGNPVSCAMGLAVLDVIKNEQLMSSAKCVGRNLVEGFKIIADRHPMMGDVRGKGMVIAVEIVTSKESRKPAKEAAELLAYKMKEDKILIANEGPDKNIMLMLPPMCLTCENARRVVQSFDKCLSEIEIGLCPENLPHNLQMIETTQITIPSNVLSAPEAMVQDAAAEGDDGPLSKRPRLIDYDDVD